MYADESVHVKALSERVKTKLGSIKLQDGQVAAHLKSVLEDHILDTYNEYRVPGNIELAAMHGVRFDDSSEHLRRATSITCSSTRATSSEPSAKTLLRHCLLDSRL